MSDPAAVAKRNLKIARTMIRLKHSLDADDEIESYLSETKEALTKGVVARLDLSMRDLFES